MLSENAQEKILDTLNNYAGDNIFPDCIKQLEEYDPALTRLVEHGHADDFATSDGTAFDYDGKACTWRARGQIERVRIEGLGRVDLWMWLTAPGGILYGSQSVAVDGSDLCMSVADYRRLASARTRDKWDDGYVEHGFMWLGGVGYKMLPEINYF